MNHPLSKRLLAACVAIAATGAQRVIVTHGSVAVMVRYLLERGLQAQAFQTQYGGEPVDEIESQEPGS